MTQPSHDTVDTHPPRPYLLSPLERTRRALSPRVGHAVAALVVGLGLFASVTPSPLYRTYSVLWHFSPLMLTLIYATYAFGVLASLLLAGGVSDDVGRRPVLLVALGALMASSVLFMFAGSAPCRASCPTSCCSSSSRSPLPASTGCRSRSRNAAASASRPSAQAFRPSCAARSSWPRWPCSRHGRSAASSSRLARNSRLI